MFSVTSTLNLHTRCVMDQSSLDASPRSKRSVSPTMWANLTHYGYWNRSFEPSLEFEEKPTEACHSLYFLLDFFHQYYIPSIILLGLVGNLLSCIVFLNTHLRVRSSSYYLAALATADFGFLVSLLFVWLNNALGWRVFNKDGWCETLVYVSAVCSSLSVWLIVAFTVERFIAVQYPLHRPHICTIARAKTIILVLVVLALTSHSYSFVTAGIVNKDGYEYCDMKVEYLETMKIISIIDSIASLIAPLVMIIVMNTMIMRNLFIFSRRFRQTSVTFTDCPSVERSDINLNQIPSGSSNNNGDGGIKMGSAVGGRRPPSQQSFHSSKNVHSHHSRQQTTSAPLSTPRTASQLPETANRCIHIRSSSRNIASTRNQQSITKMLLLISTVFIILNLPSFTMKWIWFANA
ncbi:thyrotropin-releasing hormone receptor-like isoform X2 [Ceratina calcarata]|uniref:Thyrotropin-releasing hormone receptor-like isoform X2 n=1 Tax=Ceratina calcarata TaxID=156304 RepID=A0AAJ7SB33_9HYME|nr:thyrotropin-releasing hormone receptor-like isoform X2 [Ceratina calcarata]